MNWITVDELVLAHHRIIKETGGAFGMINPAALESVLIRPFTTLEGTEPFPDLPAKVAVLIHGIIQFHPFLDGNKRTALFAADICLRLNGLRIIPSETVSHFFWQIARGEKNIEEIRLWLISHTEPFGDPQ